MNARAVGVRLAGALSAAAALGVLGAGQAVAETTNAESPVPFTVMGPVGVLAVIFGVGGLVVGLIRRRKVTPTVTEANRKIEQVSVTVPVTLPAQRRPQADHTA